MAAEIVVSDLVFLLRIDGQKDVIAKCCFEPLDGAVLVATIAGTTSNTDGADHFAVDNNGKTARVGKKSKLHQLPRLAARIVAE